MDTHGQDPKDPTELKPEDSIRVAEIRAALIEEMRAVKEGKEAITAIEEVNDLKMPALNSLRHVIEHSQNESLKARVSMWTIDKILEAEKANNDPMADFLKELNQHSSESTSKTSSTGT